MTTGIFITLSNPRPLPEWITENPTYIEDEELGDYWQFEYDADHPAMQPDTREESLEDAGFLGCEFVEQRAIAMPEQTEEPDLENEPEGCPCPRCQGYGERWLWVEDENEECDYCNGTGIVDWYDADFWYASDPLEAP